MKVRKKLTFDVAGALIEDKGKYLVCQRLEGDRFGSLWEFPGGKIKKGENKEAALRREIKEELGIEIRADGLAYTLEDEIPSMKINVYLYNCSVLDGKPRCLECQAFKWADIAEIKKLDLAPADKKIISWLDRR